MWAKISLMVVHVLTMQCNYSHRINKRPPSRWLFSDFLYWKWKNECKKSEVFAFSPKIRKWPLFGQKWSKIGLFGPKWMFFAFFRRLCIGISYFLLQEAYSLKNILRSGFVFIIFYIYSNISKKSNCTVLSFLLETSKKKNNDIMRGSDWSSMSIKCIFVHHVV